ncbi:hypothetical protein DFH28DRAFT_1078503 [Melampsora americana]|nr:hypothetical protein DFH28DRAFT_1078503 [Melampsora americana]
MNEIPTHQTLTPPLQPLISFHQRRPNSAISTSSTIIDHSSPSTTTTHHHHHPTTSIHQSLIQSTADYEHKLKLIDQNRSKLNLEESSSTFDLLSSIHQRRRITFDDDHHHPHHSLRPIKIEFLLASSSKPNLIRLNLSFNSHSKALDIKHRIKSQWPIGWTTEGLTPKRADEIKLLFLGRFLNDSETLESLRLPSGSPTIMHLLIRPSPSDSQLTKEDRDHKFVKWNCCSSSETDQTPSRCCIIS